MTPNELRALADALDGCNPYRDSSAVYSVAAYLRAQADAQPVPAVPAGWKVVPVEPTQAMNNAGLSAVNQYGKRSVWETYAAMLAAAPAAPQAEPSLGELMREQRRSRIVAGAYPDGNPNAVAMMAQTPQAEPKREPLPGLAPTHRCPACGALWRQCDDASWNLRSALCCGLCDAGRVELVRLLDEPKREPLSEATALIEWPESAKWKNRAAPEGIERSCMAEPKREPLSDWRITKGEYVLATKFSDGDPGDHWGVGFYDRFENGRHYVIDIAGKQIRGNGFRRAGRITADVGRWLLSAAKSLEASPPGTVNLWTMLTERAHGIGGSDE